MKKLSLLLAIVFAVGVTAAFTGGFRNLRARLNGFNEVPAVSTVGKASFKARINNNQTIDYELSYSDLEGAVQQAHIHFGQKGVNGGITVFLCTNLGNGPASSDTSQPCPPSPATVKGTISPDEISPNIPATAGARTQGIDTGQFAELVRAIRAGVTYANVHSDRWPGGEVRDQIDAGHDGHGDHD